MAIMLEEIELPELPDVFDRAPIDYPSAPTPELGPFCQPDLYEVRCSNLTGLIEFYWDGMLIGVEDASKTAWPDQTLPYLPSANTPDGIKYFYYATGKNYRKIWNDIENNTIYCYSIQRVDLSA